MTFTVFIPTYVLWTLGIILVPIILTLAIFGLYVLWESRNGLY